ncbi:hypothetical protein PO909_029726 [Leuciscus waleckii]
MGEAGVDTGALRKEFLTEMISGIETRLFEGENDQGKMPKYSLNDLDNGLFRAIAMHASAQRTLMLQQLRQGLQLYHLVDIMEKNKEVCRGLFVFEGGNDQVRTHYIVSHLDPQMSESGTLKHSKEMQILNNFQDFFMELEGKFVVTQMLRQCLLFTALDGDSEALSVSKVMQWLSGQTHRPSASFREISF